MYKIFSVFIVFVLVFMGCNRDNEIAPVSKPVISFDHADGIYEVYVGDELTISPTVGNDEEAEFVWTLDDGTVVCRQRVWTSRWNIAGEYYATLTVTAPGGTAREEIRIDVIEKMPPSISIALPSDGLTIKTATAYEFSPLFGNIRKGETLTVDWFVNGQKEGEGQTFVFTPESQGVYSIKIVAANNSGSTEKIFTVTVMDNPPAKLRFAPLSYFMDDSIRYTIVGRLVALNVIGENVSETGYEWSVDGHKADCNSSFFAFATETVGTHKVTVTNNGAQTAMTVVCYGTLTSQPSYGAGAVSKVYEYVPAPGQFIGDTSSAGGMPEEMLTRQQAETWALDRLNNHQFVSLGAWGGYIVAGFDNSIKNNHSGYDFAVMGNAITTSNEPGIVWVMQDVNGNGIPDDEWYQLRGSDFDGNSTSHSWAATYFRPGGNNMGVQWVDADGIRGLIEYIADTHKQPSYFPAWIDADDYTLYGVRLPSRTQMDPVTGNWSNLPYDWGYADNIGSDMTEGETQEGAGQWVGFKISNAVLPDGTSVNLDHIDFIKIQTGVMATAGRLGELSTEILGIKAL